MFNRGSWTMWPWHKHGEWRWKVIQFEHSGDCESYVHLLLGRIEYTDYCDQWFRRLSLTSSLSLCHAGVLLKKAAKRVVVGTFGVGNSENVVLDGHRGSMRPSQNYFGHLHAVFSLRFTAA